MALTAQQRKFKTVAKAAQATCIRESSSVRAYKACMSEQMTRGLKARSRPKRKRGRR